MGARRLGLAAGSALLALCACTTGTAHTPAASTLPVPSGATWPTYHRDAARMGLVPGVPSPTALRSAWTADLDGAVYGQPLLVRGTLLAATENDSLYGLSPADGHVLWRQHVGEPAPLSSLPCGDIDPLGVTGTPVLEPSTGLVFAVAELRDRTHELVGVDPVTGALRVHRAVEAPRGDPAATQQRGALAVLDGRVLIAFGGLFGDCGNYVGAVVSVPATGSGPVRSYSVPTSREGGIWATGGPVVTTDGTVLVSVGNGASTGGYDGSDSVIALTAQLTRADWFAPADWAADNRDDLDLGSMTPALVGADRVLIVGKRGTAYALDRARLGGIGGQLAQARLCSAYGTAAVQGRSVYVPCSDALARVDMDPDGTLHPRWQAAFGAAGSPVIGGGAVWAVDYAAGELRALDPATGRVLTQAPTGPVPHFVSPVLSGSRVFLGTTTGVRAFDGG